MRCVYQARDGLEAHMVADMLQQLGIAARVQGDLLQGGIGELPAAGLVSVWVDNEEEVRARELVESYQREQPDISAPRPVSAPVSSAGFLAGVMVGFFAGVLVMLMLLR
ncbi:MAG: DUF2007 domain-containing protein [Alcanivorax sediminis]|uniref:putative signal transducing protein n=1 Tax=Alcanivorax sediminis TaxID=2663008 RepID=UPI003C5590C6